MVTHAPRSRCLPAFTAAVFCIVFPMTVFALPAGSGPGASDDSKNLVFSEEFALRPGGRLTIDVDDLDIHVKTGSGREGVVEVYVKGSGRDDAHEWLEKTHFEAHLDGNILVIENRAPNRVNFGFGNWFRNTRVWAVVHVPARTDVSINTEDGDVQIDDLEGDAHVRTEDGDLEFSTVRGASVEISTEDGDVKAGSLEAGEVTVVTEDGDLNIDGISAKRIHVASSDGDISVTRIDGGRISIETDDGDIDVTVAGERLDARCSDGDMTIRLLAKMDVDVESNDGDIVLHIPRDMGADIDLRGRHLAVHDIAITGRVSDDVIKGSIGNGGASIRVKAGDGSIRIRED